MRAPVARARDDRSLTACESSGGLRGRSGGALQDFDVFLCHKGSDKPAIRAIADQRAAGASFLGSTRSSGDAAFRGSESWSHRFRGSPPLRSSWEGGLGPWREAEQEAFLREFGNRGCPVIPVLLADAPEQPSLPLFLQGMTWVDFRRAEPDPLDQRVFGITGARPQAPLQRRGPQRSAELQVSKGSPARGTEDDVAISLLHHSCGAGMLSVTPTAAGAFEARSSRPSRRCSRPVVEVRMKTPAPTALVVCFAIASPPLGAVAQDVRNDPRVAEAVHLLRVWADAQQQYTPFPGVSIAAVHDQEVVWSEGFGYADLETHEPATPPLRLG